MPRMIYLRSDIKKKKRRHRVKFLVLDENEIKWQINSSFESNFQKVYLLHLLDLFFPGIVC